MQWFKSYLPKEDAETKVMDFVPQKIDMGTPSQAIDYLKRKEKSDFRMSGAVQVQTGVDRIEQLTENEKIEKRALELMSEVQEKAYREAYELGLAEGEKKAFAEAAHHITTGVDELEKLLGSLRKIKQELNLQNETHLVQLVFHIASRIAMRDLQDNPEAVVEIMKQAVGTAEEEESVRVQVNQGQFDFLEGLKKQSGREYEFLKMIRLEPSSDIQPGGCVIETNYGEVDARIEQRLQSLWESLAQSTPRVKETVTEKPDEN